MKVSWIHRDRCTKCKEIIWTQTDDKPQKESRPNLACQCYCGDTFIDNETTTSGGGEPFTEKEFKDKVQQAHVYESAGVAITKKVK